MSSHAFSDGSPAVPLAVPGVVERVIVVGAGMAGLTVANALLTAGVECVVVEARDRIGGRLHTVDVDGHPADLGGAWIHHPHTANTATPRTTCWPSGSTLRESRGSSTRPARGSPAPTWERAAG
ncbi:FAD-dependent oxidoreductase [Nocardioides sp. Kera G14]|uniref:FAD-dependent oxidoreductase n=1 Tax=Nocardioides sp. Kera G14 TaxID=2884264 RepID=UPI002AB17C3B|nr:FAD-dependent oxidoreductase [Nocardioides sp. Kera G14]